MLILYFQIQYLPIVDLMQILFRKQVDSIMLHPEDQRVFIQSLHISHLDYLFLIKDDQLFVGFPFVFYRSLPRVSRAGAETRQAAYLLRLIHFEVYQFCYYILDVEIQRIQVASQMLGFLCFPSFQVFLLLPELIFQDSRLTIASQ